MISLGSACSAIDFSFSPGRSCEHVCEQLWDPAQCRPEWSNRRDETQATSHRILRKDPRSAVVHLKTDAPVLEDSQNYRYRLNDLICSSIVVSGILRSLYFDPVRSARSGPDIFPAYQM